MMNEDKNATPNIKIGGNISGGNVNVGGTQTFHGNVTINTGTMPAASEDVRKSLEDLFKQLADALAQEPADKTAEVEEVKVAAEDAVEEANKPQPNTNRLKIRGDNLMKAAKNLAAVAPIAVEIAKKLLLIG